MCTFWVWICVLYCSLMLTDPFMCLQTSVWLFPEGTRGHAAEIDLLPFKKGAFYMAVQAGVPVVPIVVANYNTLYDSKTKRFNAGTIKIKGN